MLLVLAILQQLPLPAMVAFELKDSGTQQSHHSAWAIAWEADAMPCSAADWRFSAVD